MDGAHPSGSLVQGADGKFYGMTPDDGLNGAGINFDGAGTIFRINADGTGMSTLYSFTGGNDGGSPYGSLILGSDGFFYGMSLRYGASGAGTIFKIDTSGNFTLIYGFTGNSDGSSPTGALVQGSDGIFYGMTQYAGDFGYGNIFQLATPTTLAAPIVLSVPASVTHGTTFTLGYKASNATSATLKSCQYFATDASGTQVATGALTATPTTQTTTLTAPATAGTYTYALTCGGIETGFATLTVN